MEPKRCSTPIPILSQRTIRKLRSELLITTQKLCLERTGELETLRRDSMTKSRWSSSRRISSKITFRGTRWILAYGTTLPGRPKRTSTLIKRGPCTETNSTSPSPSIRELSENPLAEWLKKQLFMMEATTDWV
jgi:hypothetical protein